MKLTFKGKIMNSYDHVKDTLIEAIVADTSEAGLVLFLYLMSKAQKYDWRDEGIANNLGWSLAKLKRTKKLLKDKGWIDYWRHKGNSYLYVGKDQVSVSKKDKEEAGVK